MDWLINARLSNQEALKTARDDLKNDIQSGTLMRNIENFEKVRSHNRRGAPLRPVLVVPGEPRGLVNWTGGKLEIRGSPLSITTII